MRYCVYHLGLQVACSALRPKPLLVIAALLAFGCNKNHDETRSSAKSLTDPSSITDFSSLDATAWVNGAPVSLAEARGKNVVLIEAWHPA